MGASRDFCPDGIYRIPRLALTASALTTPDCLQLMTNSHHLMALSSHVGGNYILIINKQQKRNYSNGFWFVSFILRKSNTTICLGTTLDSRTGSQIGLSLHESVNTLITTSLDQKPKLLFVSTNTKMYYNSAWGFAKKTKTAFKCEIKLPIKTHTWLHPSFKIAKAAKTRIRPRVNMKQSPSATWFTFTQKDWTSCKSLRNTVMVNYE